MTQQLTKGMYGHEFRNTSSLFGIRCGQCRSQDMVHNGGWYNKAGEKLGWGDLSPEDFLKIAKELEEGELFIILPESASFWNFVENIGAIGSMCTTKPDIEAPGVDYVAENASYVIAKSAVYLVNRYDCHRQEGEVVTHYGLSLRVLRPDSFRTMLGANTHASA